MGCWFSAPPPATEAEEAGVNEILGPYYPDRHCLLEYFGDGSPPSSWYTMDPEVSARSTLEPFRATSTACRQGSWMRRISCTLCRRMGGLCRVHLGALSCKEDLSRL